MSLTNLSFLSIYFPLLLIAYYNPIFKSATFRKILLACASLGLYAFAEPIYSLLLFCVILFNFCFVKIADWCGKNFYRGLAIVFDVLILLGFKYINAIIPFVSASDSFDTIAFPIGLSYFTFKAISYVVDSNQEKDGNLLDVTIYIANFLTIVSGPLSTYKDELPTIREKKTLDEKFFYRGLERFVIGLGKKIIIADNLGVLVSQCFSSSDLSVFMAWSGAIAYTLQLFFDFSGYTDMAIGLGYLFGFNLPENFNYPYMASSISDFWKRWHISLTKWFTKYIYIPLGGSRVKSVIRHIFNLFVVWLVTGIWHGSSITFILWAMIYFILQLIEKYTRWSVFLTKTHIGHFYTLIIVILEFVIFKSSGISSALFYLRSLFGLTDNSFIYSDDLQTTLAYAIPLILGIVFSTTLGSKACNFLKSKPSTNVLYNTGLIALFVICMILTIGQGYVAPLYAGF